MILWSELNCTHTAVLANKGKSFVLVLFERGEDLAEGILPDCVIQRNKGFSRDEVQELEAYLTQNRQKIYEAAKGITNLKNLFS